MRIEVFPMGVFQVNSYLLRCEETGAVLVVDPGDEPERLVARLDEWGAVPEGILNTHGHLDHVSGNTALKARYGVPIRMHPDDDFLLEAFADQAAAFGLQLTPPPPADAALAEGDVVRFGRCALTVRRAPGHSPGHVVLVGDGDVISGDVLFAGSIGRTDLPGGNLGTLLRSIDEVMLPLGDAMRVHPGHGPATTIGEERRTNPFLSAAGRRSLTGGR